MTTVMEKIMLRNSLGLVGGLPNLSRVIGEDCGCKPMNMGRGHSKDKSPRQCLRGSVGIAGAREAEVPRTEEKGKCRSSGGGHRGTDLEETCRTDIHST